MEGQTITREAGRWVRTVTGSAKLPPGARLRVIADGPVAVEGDSPGGLTYTVKAGVKAGSEAEARRLLSGFAVQVSQQGDWVVFTVPRGATQSEVALSAPRGLRELVVATGDGMVTVNGVDGQVRVNATAGSLRLDRIGGDARLITGGGEIRLGDFGAALQCSTGGGPISVRSVRGEATLETAGGDIVADTVGGMIRASTGGGSIRIGSAGGAVAASTGGGPIVIGKAAGVVTARNAAGPVQVGAASGVRSESGAGGVRLSNVSGSMRVSTAMGSIVAGLLGGKLADSFLATGGGDVTVFIPSNLGVTIRAENETADTLRRIVSEYPGLAVRMRGTRVVAEGPINGGGPELRISGTGGTIFIKRQN